MFKNLLAIAVFAGAVMFVAAGCCSSDGNCTGKAPVAPCCNEAGCAKCPAGAACPTEACPCKAAVEKAPEAK